ncbi:MAG: hypothetical protein ACYTAO_01625 [Planctomycetota bacterium]|jgi:hypothetical protein
MAKRKAGLHKDVSTMFKGVWDPEVDNLQPFFDEPATATVTYVHPKGMALNQWPKEPRSATIVKAFTEAPGHLFRSRSRRERKRLLSISKHLIINQPS